MNSKSRCVLALAVVLAGACATGEKGASSVVLVNEETAVAGCEALGSFQVSRSDVEAAFRLVRGRGGNVLFVPGWAGSEGAQSSQTSTAVGYAYRCGN